MAKEKDIFESIDLDTAMKEVNLDGQEATEEDLKLAEMGFELRLVEAYKKRFEKDTVLYQGYPIKAFFEWYLKSINNTLLKQLFDHKDKLKENQVKQLESTQIIDVVKEPSNDSIQGYIEKNAELIAEKDKLFKQIQVLQSERDQWKELTEKSDKYMGLAIQLIRIFKEQKIKADLPTETIQLIKELSSK